MPRVKQYAVTACGQWTDEEEGRRRLPAGEVHTWHLGMNQTVCGLSLSRSRLIRFSHGTWPDTSPEPGGAADRVRRQCPRCASVVGPPRRRRTSPSAPHQPSPVSARGHLKAPAGPRERRTP